MFCRDKPMMCGLWALGVLACLLAFACDQAQEAAAPREAEAATAQAARHPPTGLYARTTKVTTNTCDAADAALPPQRVMVIVRARADELGANIPIGNARQDTDLSVGAETKRPLARPAACERLEASNTLAVVRVDPDRIVIRERADYGAAEGCVTPPPRSACTVEREHTFELAEPRCPATCDVEVRANTGDDGMDVECSCEP